MKFFSIFFLSNQIWRLKKIDLTWIDHIKIFVVPLSLIVSLSLIQNEFSFWQRQENVWFSIDIDPI